MDKKNYIWLIPCIMILIALVDMPYGYYKLLRFIVCGFCIFLTVQEAKVENQNKWVWIIGATALLYNPFIPIHLDRDTWQFVNLITIIGFFVHWKFRRNNLKI